MAAVFLGDMKKYFGFLFWSFCTLAPVTALAAVADPSYVQLLQQQAEEARLADDPYWHRLLHYRPGGIAEGVSSTVDDRLFFLAEDGKHNPIAEMNATLASFFGDVSLMGEQAQCRFRARYQWLRERLTFDASRLPEQACPLFDEWMNNIRPASMTMVFAASDLNSPATMYGHTLLRVDRDGQADDQHLLSYAVSYAASIATGENMIFYTVKGLGGGFAGQYSIYRYHEKIRQYSRINNRDVWEYRLILSLDEVRRVMWHLWEMRNIGSDYYFFSENCAYMTLALLNTARPGLDLTSEFERNVPYTIPVDALRALQAGGLIERPQFRPSLARRLQSRVDQLAPQQREWVAELGLQQPDFLDDRYAAALPAERARMLEAASDLLYFRYSENGVSRSDALPAERAILAQRSRIEVPAAFSEVPVPATPPEQGHATARVLSGLRQSGAASAATLRVRAAYHDRLDPPAGYLPGGELEFFQLALSAGNGRLRVTDLDLVGVQALSPWSRLFRSPSWQVAAGLRRPGLDRFRANPGHGLGGYVDGGGGIVLSPIRATYAYGFLYAEGDANPDLNRGHALASGIRAGVAVNRSDYWTQELRIDWLAPVSGDAANRLNIKLGMQWQLTRSNGVRLELVDAREGHERLFGGEVTWAHYF